MNERRTAMVTFRTTAALKALAERLAKSEGRSLANLLERLIWDGWREGLGRAAPYRPTGEDLRNIGADNAA
jgi:hypothetical protein